MIFFLQNILKCSFVSKIVRKKNVLLIKKNFWNHLKHLFEVLLKGQNNFRNEIWRFRTNKWLDCDVETYKNKLEKKY